MTSTTARTEKALIPKKLRVQLWKRLDRRLQRGEVLVTRDQFLKVMEREFRKLVAVAPSKAIKAELQEMISALNEFHPEIFLSLGIKNAMTRYFNEAQDRMQGQSIEKQHQALEMVSEIIRGGRVDFFLESIGVEIPEKGVSPKIIEAVKKIVDGQRMLPAFKDLGREVKRRCGSELVPVKYKEEEKVPQSSDVEAVYGPLPGEEEEQES